MRIDEINLIGNFKINGLTGGSSQGIGYSGSSVYWISVTGSGGGGSVGPQGNTGPAFVHTSYTDVGTLVAFGDGSNGLTFSESFKYLHTTSTNCQNLLIGPTNSTARFSTSSVIISSFSASNNFNLNSMIISSSASNICSSNFSFIGSSVNSRICPGSDNSVILAADTARIANSKNSSSIGGEQSEISNHNAGITLGGKVARVNSGTFSAILGGDNNCITGNQNIILGGFQNYVGTTNPSVNSVIIGGKNNCMINTTHNSAIIGGRNNALSVTGTSCQSAIIGASGSALFSGDNCIVFEKLHVHNFAKFDQYTNASPSNGDLWWDQTTSKLMFRTNGNDYCIEC